LTDWNLVSGEVPQTEKENDMTVMWTKILLRVLAIGVNAVPWERIAEMILNRLAARIRESSATLETLSPHEFLTLVEEVLSDKLKLNLDLNHDRKVGDGFED